MRTSSKPTFSSIETTLNQHAPHSKTGHFDPSQVLKIADSERATLLEQLSRSCNELAEGRQGRGCWDQAMTRQLTQVMVTRGL